MSLMAAMDIFRFWATVKRKDRIHPADRDVFARVKQHSFDLRCLPAASPAVVIALHGRGALIRNAARCSD
jgi:hypothetical protein